MNPSPGGPTIEEQLARVDLTASYPPFLRAVRAGLQRCNDRGAFYYVVCWWRSFQESLVLSDAFRKGLGPRAAPPGQSSHNYGIAVDFAFDLKPYRKGLQPDWKNPQYEILGEEMQRLGLKWGGDWNSNGIRELGEDDLPHVEWPMPSLTKLKSVYLGVYGEPPRDVLFRYVDTVCASTEWQLRYPLLVPFLKEAA